MAQMYTIRVHAIPLSDGDGKGANTVSKATFQEAVARLDLFRVPLLSDKSNQMNPELEEMQRELERLREENAELRRHERTRL